MPEDEPWTHTSDRAVWRAYKRSLVLTVTASLVAAGKPPSKAPASPNGPRCRSEHASAPRHGRTAALAVRHDRPLGTEQQAWGLPAVRAVCDAFERDPGVGKMTPHCRRILDDACSPAGVETGAYDHRILVCASCTPPLLLLRDTVAALPWRSARLGPGRRK